MVIVNTQLSCADNSGARVLVCIKIMGNSKTTKADAHLGSFVRVSIKKSKSNIKINKKGVYFALIISKKKRTTRLDGTIVVFDSNRALLFDDKKKFLGTRIYGPITKEIKNSKSMYIQRIVNYSKGTI